MTEASHIRFSGLALITSLAVILVLTLIPFDFDWSPDAVVKRWGRVEWQLIYYNRDGGWSASRDFIQNVLLFLPFGISWVLWRRNRSWRLLLETSLLGITLALAIETSQLLLPGRVSQIADVGRNGLGALLGAAATLLVMSLTIRSGANADIPKSRLS